MYTQKVRITDIIVIRRDVDLSNYPGMTPEEAVKYEQDLDAPEVVESIMSELSTEEPMVFERTVVLATVKDEMDEAVQLTLPNVVEAGRQITDEERYGRIIPVQHHSELFGSHEPGSSIPPIQPVNPYTAQTQQYDPIFDGHKAE